MLKQSFNRGWMFSRGDGGTLAALLGNAATPVEVCIPHDASVKTIRDPEEQNGSGNGYFREESYTYTKNFPMAAEDVEKNIWLEF